LEVEKKRNKSPIRLANNVVAKWDLRRDDSLGGFDKFVLSLKVFNFKIASHYYCCGNNMTVWIYFIRSGMFTAELFLYYF
jgi:hypothetical protein